jgi:hypothetical protein
MHVITHVAWCSFSSFDPFSFILSFIMFLWDLLASHSLLILIVLLVAPTPSDALPMNVTLPLEPRGDTCRGGGTSPCVCKGAYGLGFGVDAKKCGAVVWTYTNVPQEDDVAMVSPH